MLKHFVIDDSPSNSTEVRGACPGFGPLEHNSRGMLSLKVLKALLEADLPVVVKRAIGFVGSAELLDRQG